MKTVKSVKCKNWREVDAEVKRIANGLPIYYGSGSPIDRPHVIVVTNDALNGQGMGYDVWVYPNGDSPGPHAVLHFLVVVEIG